MTLYSYKLSSKAEKAICLWQNGVFIADRKDGNYLILLYQLHNFYVEIWYLNNVNKIDRTRTFSSTEPLKPYLDQIDISASFVI